jgi:hypothetical protein
MKCDKIEKEMAYCNCSTAVALFHMKGKYRQVLADRRRMLK